MRRINLILILLFTVTLAAQGQSIRDFIKQCDAVQINTRFNKKTSTLAYEYHKYGYGDTYRMPCDLKTSTASRCKKY